MATQIILCHCHPSGNLSPSRQDVHLTEQIKRAASFLEITVSDHLIISKESYYSMAINGLI